MPKHFQLRETSEYRGASNPHPHRGSRGWSSPHFGSGGGALVCASHCGNCHPLCGFLNNYGPFGGDGDHGGSLNIHPHLGVRGGDPSNHHSHLGDAPWNHLHHHHPDLHQANQTSCKLPECSTRRGTSHSNTVTRSFPDLRQENQASYKLPETYTISYPVLHQAKQTSYKLSDSRPGRRTSHSSVTRSFPNLHQAKQTSYKLPKSTREVGSTPSSQTIEKKRNSSEESHELSIKPNNSSSSKFALRPNFDRNRRKCVTTTNHFRTRPRSFLPYIQRYNELWWFIMIFTTLVIVTSICAAMLAPRSQAFQIITMFCGMIRSSLHINFKFSQIINVTYTQGPSASCHTCHQHIMLS